MSMKCSDIQSLVRAFYGPSRRLPFDLTCHLFLWVLAFPRRGSWWSWAVTSDIAEAGFCFGVLVWGQRVGSSADLIAKKRTVLESMQLSLFQVPLTHGICQVPFHLRCQQPTNCRPCTPSQQSCKDWQWSSSGCTGILTCTVVIYQVRKIITGERCHKGFWRLRGAMASFTFLHIPSFPLFPELLPLLLGAEVLSWCTRGELWSCSKT